MNSEQQDFWRGEFGTEYIARNESPELLASNLHLFASIFSRLEFTPSSFIEFGANIGMNARALKLLFPGSYFTGIEINEDAHLRLKSVADTAILSSIEEMQIPRTHEVSFTKGVLIHVAPKNLKTVYEKMYLSSSRYILVAEYYSRSPDSLNYRGHADKLYKRDFAGEILDLYPDLRLASYGFSYHRAAAPQDDITWFILEKSQNA